MPVHLHRAVRTDVLADALGELLAMPQADPFATELVVVPAKGVERWLSQRLSHRLGAAEGHADGVCAGVEFRNPWSLFAEIAGTREADPWAPDALVWPLLAVLDSSLDEPWAATLAQHLGHFEQGGEEADLRRGRRYAVAHRLARHVAAYAGQRPTLLADWLDGRETDGTGHRLDEDLLWQPELFRRLADRVGTPPPHRRHADLVARLRDRPETLELPGRLSLFGHTRIAETEAELLAALGAHRDVHLWLPHPSDDLWRRLGDTAAEGPVVRTEDESHRLVGHPLLATLGRDVRELQRTLTPVVDHDHHHPPAGPPPDTLLGWLQQDIRGNAVAPAGRRLGEGDRSVQVHACHGPARQVEVLREVLLGLLADDETLEPRDILVMCPDIEAYAPLITATFGLGDVLDDPHPAHRLRVRLADRAPGRINPLLGVAATLLDLAGGRATASQVLDLAQAPAVRRRFGFTDDDLEILAEWVRDAGIRWAFDADHRRGYGLSLVHNTWAFGLDRVLTGVAAAPRADGALDTALPLDDVDSNRVDLAGRFAEYVDRLQATTDGLTGSRPLADWLATLTEGVGLLAEPDAGELWQSGHLHRELTDLLTAAGDLAGTGLRLPDVRAMLADHLAGRPGRANFRTGTLTVCTMVPMRSVPHRVVCLLGVDDGVFPRHPVPDGDDVLARRPRTGERDARSEDRQLLLDAVLAARETLVVTYAGRDEHTGQQRPPAVPVGELLDVLDITTEQPVRGQVRVAHPLQPFDARNLQPGRLGAPGPFSFDAAAVAAAGALAGDRPEAPAFFDSPLALDPREDVVLDDLVGFFNHPVKGFFRALDVALPWEAPRLSDAITVDPDELAKWAVGDRILHDVLARIHPNDALAAEWRRGVLPPGRLGWRIGQQIRDQAKELARAALDQRAAPRRTADVDVELGDGRRLSGSVADVYGGRLVTVGYSKLGGKQLLQAWIRLLALSAADPDANYTALVIGRAPAGEQSINRLLGPVDHRATALLTDLVELYDEGRRRPLPLPLRTSYAWARAETTHADPVLEADRKWKSGRYPGENADDAHVRIWGRHAPLSALVGLGDLATRLWQPLFEHERGSL